MEELVNELAVKKGELRRINDQIREKWQMGQRLEFEVANLQRQVRMGAENLARQRQEHRLREEAFLKRLELK